MVTRPCGHCGQTCGDYDGGYGSVTDERGTIYLCHPNDPSRPDCYRRVTVYHEQAGALIGVTPKPAGVTDITGGRDPLAELLALSQELAVPATVCTTHLRFVPCRRDDGCVISEDPAEVVRVSAYQWGAYG